MPAKNIIALLSATAAFSGLSADRLSRIASLFKEQKFAEGAVLAKEGEHGDELFLIIEGSLGLRKLNQDALIAEYLGKVSPGEITGELALLTGHPRAATITAEEPSVVASLSRVDFEQFCLEFPHEMESVIAWMRTRLHTYQIQAAVDDSPLLKGLSPELKSKLKAKFQWMELRSGAILFRQGEPGDVLYLIVSGRIQLFQTENNSESAPSENVLNELGKGDVLGEMALLTDEPRSATACAVRDTQLAVLNRVCFDQIVAEHPKELLGLFARQMAGRLREQNLGRPPKSRPLTSIAIFTCSPVAADFAGQLAQSLSTFGATLHLSKANVSTLISDRPLAADAAETRLLSWLNDQEARYRHVVYETDMVDDAWTFLCLRQADVLIFAVDGKEDPFAVASRLQSFVQRAGHPMQAHLVLCYGKHAGLPANTKTWLRAMKVSRHWNIRAGVIDDAARIARSLNGKSIGLVLGGGFAYGLAHIGVVQAFRDLGIPIDHVGGTSMGAIIGMSCAYHYSYDKMLEIMQKGCVDSLKGDYTLPIVSLLTGRKVALSIGPYVEGLDIEDLWLPYFAISSSLVHARMVVHDKGDTLRTLLASSRVPGIFPPLGWDDDVLVDGGLVNNVPCDVMRNVMGSGTVIAVDISPDTDFSVKGQFDLHLSGWRLAARKLNPFSRHSKLITITGIISRMVRLGGVAQLRQIRSSADLYLIPPLEHFTYRDFHRGEELARAGYEYTLAEMQQWIAKNGRPWANSIVTEEAQSQLTHS